jgi:hypothetical protein
VPPAFTRLCCVAALKRPSTPALGGAGSSTTVSILSGWMPALSLPENGMIVRLSAGHVEVI